MAAIEPMNQFKIHEILHLPPIHMAGGTLDLSITNSVAFMLAATALISLFFLTAARGALVPGRMQALAETLYDLVDNGLTGSMIGDRGRPFMPFVFTLFSFIAVMNVIGLIPFSFTATSQLAITAGLALMTFLIVIAVGFARNGLGFFKLFVPGGMHWGMLFLMIPLELVSFFVRPVTLALRLFGNMVGGHVVLYMFGSFVVALGAFAIHTGGIGYLGFLGAGLSMTMLIALFVLEIIVALLQAFVFAALTCSYLSDVVNLDHGH